MDVGRLKELMEWMARSDLTEFELSENGVSIRLERSSVSGAIEQVNAAEPAANDATDTIIAAPMSGTFYASSAPDEPPFVSVGDRLSVGRPLCVIEAMKVMNRVEAERAGTVKIIHVRSGEDVEAGRPLFTLEA